MAIDRVFTQAPPDEEVYLTSLRPRALDDCIGQLSQNTQRCLTLAFVEGRSHDEIARLTSNPLGSVKSWIRRGLISLKECLSAERQTA